MTDGTADSWDESDGDPDLERFWTLGSEALDSMLGDLRSRIEPGDRVVEIGCGVGRVTRALAARAAVVWALDTSPETITKARELNMLVGNAEFMVGGEGTLEPLGDAGADVVHAHDLFLTTSDRSVTLAYVREIGRVLCPGGWAFFPVPNQAAPERPRRSVEALTRSFKTLVGRGPTRRAAPPARGPAIELADVEQAAVEGGTEMSRTADGKSGSYLVRLDKPG